MKYGMRLAALLMALILLCGCALAEDDADLPDMNPLPTAVPGRPEPPLKNPQDYYEVYVDQTDGSEELIYMVLDITNDEEELVDEHGSVTLVAQVMDERGNCVSTIYTGLLKCEYGLVMRSWSDAFGGMYVTYITERGEIGTTSGRITDVDPDSELSQDLDGYWHGCLFPYTAPQVMNGMRQDADGNTCFLIMDDLDHRVEYVVNSAMEIKEVRDYAPVGEDWYLSMVVTSRYDDLTIPDDVLAEISKLYQEKI